MDDVECATLEWVDWFNHRRLLEPIGHIPPAEFETAHYQRKMPTTQLDSSNQVVFPHFSGVALLDSVLPN
jgi:hypothetical protein